MRMQFGADRQKGARNLRLLSLVRRTGCSERDARRVSESHGKAESAASLTSVSSIVSSSHRAAARSFKLALPRAALSGEDGVVVTGLRAQGGAAAIPVRPFQDPDPFHELVFANPIAARRAIADEIRVPLATLSDDDKAFIDALLDRSLPRPEILVAVRDRFPLGPRGGVG